MSVYRTPAEDHEAKLDAAEVATFRRDIQSQQRRAKLRGLCLVAVVVGAVVVATGTFAREGEMRRRRLNRDAMITTYTLQCAGTPLHCDPVFKLEP